MPEGDTIHTIARFIAPRLAERTVRNVRMADAVGAKRCKGRQVRLVEARGKHLLIELDNDTVLRSHLGMYGAWHHYAVDERWRKPRWQASLVIATDDDVFVCFNAKEVELLDSPSVRERILCTRLGPDLIHEDTDIGLVVRRARELVEGDTLLGDVLLDQRVACGIGNVYKSEVLFIEGWLPHTTLEQVGDDVLGAYYATAADLLRLNTRGGRRVTRFEKDKAGRLWVYGRRGLPCLRCDDGQVVAARLGKHHRGTYWCPSCQH